LSRRDFRWWPGLTTPPGTHHPANQNCAEP
jgi:hypothetical protein